MYIYIYIHIPSKMHMYAKRCVERVKHFCSARFNHTHIYHCALRHDINSILHSVSSFPQHYIFVFSVRRAPILSSWHGGGLTREAHWIYMYIYIYIYRYIYM